MQMKGRVHDSSTITQQKTLNEYDTYWVLEPASRLQPKFPDLARNRFPVIQLVASQELVLLF